MQFWLDIQQSLQDFISEDEFLTWIKPLNFVEFKESEYLLLSAHNSVIRDHVLEEFKRPFARAFEELNQASLNLKIRVEQVQKEEMNLFEDSSDSGSSKTGVQSPVGSQTKDWKHSEFTSNLDPKYTFDNFVEGSSNQFAYAAAQQVAEFPGTGSNPLVIYGSVGLGKTHLMLATGNEIKRRNPNARVLYMSTHSFRSQIVNAIRHKKIDDLKQFYNSMDVLLVDDIQFLSTGSKTQEEFFHLFNHLFENKSQIILTCDRFPKKLVNIEDRLVSRFSWGLTVYVEPPELETRVAILKQKAQDYQFKLSDDVAFFIAKHIMGHVRDLEGALTTVRAHANFMGLEATVPLVREALREQIVVHASILNIDNIQKMVADYYDLSLSDLLSKSRARSIARPRQMAMALAKEFTQMSLPDIGRAFGGRDHTTVMHACKKINELKQEDANTQGDWKNLVRRLQS